jgi:hypothetical protein
MHPGTVVREGAIINFLNKFFKKCVNSHLENRVLETKKLFFNHNGEIYSMVKLDNFPDAFDFGRF